MRFAPATSEQPVILDEIRPRAHARGGMQVATVATGGGESHAPARRAYEKAGFDRAIPSVWMCRRL